MSNELPECCYILHRNAEFSPHGERIALVKRGEQGYWPIDGLRDDTLAAATATGRTMNERLGVTGLRAYCMKMGSLFGFDGKGVSPEWVSEHIKSIDFSDASGEEIINAN